MPLVVNVRLIPPLVIGAEGDAAIHLNGRRPKMDGFVAALLSMTNMGRSLPELEPEGGNAEKGEVAHDIRYRGDEGSR